MRIVVAGSGQTGNMVASILSEQENEIVGFVDDAHAGAVEAHGFPVLGDRTYLLDNAGRFDAVCVGVGSIRGRRHLIEWLEQNGVPTVSAIHGSVVMSPEVVLGDNLIIGASTTLYINPVIGSGCFIGPSVTVSHDTVVGDFCLLSVGSVIGARCDIDEGVLVGSGAILMPPAFSPDARLQVGRNAIVGVGATVIRNVEPDTTVVGTPAKPIRRGPE